MPSPIKTVSWAIFVAVVSFAGGRWSVQRTSAPRLAPNADATSGRRAGGLKTTEASSAISSNGVDFGSGESTTAAEGGKRFETLSAEPASAARNEALAATLKGLAASEPERALAIAASQKNRLLRQDLIQAALSGWASVAPGAAADWAFSLSDQAKRSEAMETVFKSSAATHPDEAVTLGRALVRKDPGGATGYGCSLVEALCASGRFEMAAGFASDPDALDSVGRSILRAKTYSAWATMEPENAARAAAALNDSGERSEAMNAALGGWSQVDPEGAVQFVSRLGAGSERIQMMGQALHQWAEIDSTAATEWVRKNELGPGTDDGIAAVAGAGFLAPSEAADWTQDIANPALRSQTLLTVLRNWANTDPDAARRYLDATSSLQPADRAAATALFTPPGGP
jgi:hypothetical protein